MNRLQFVMAYTHDIEGMKRFYRDAIGIGVANDTPFFVQFEGDESCFSLLAMRPEVPNRIELVFESLNLDADIRALRRRGVEFIDDVRSEAFGRVIHLRDPEGNLISLLESPAGASGSGNSSPAAAVSKPARSGAKAAATALATDRARFSTVIVNCADVAATKAFYRDRLGLKLEIDSPSWVSFPVGGVTLALHPRIETPATESHHEGDVTLGFMVSDLIAWADEARDRGVHFTSAPEDEDFGMFADTADPDGNEITFREPLAEPALEEKLAEEFEDDEVPHQVAIRKTVKKGVKAVSRVAVRPEYQSETAPKRKVAKKPASRSTRGAGAAGSRLKPKRAADTKRARTRPATGRLKKAERRTLNTKKLAVAGSSKSKPVKHASAGARKSSPKKRALAARGRKH